MSKVMASLPPSREDARAAGERSCYDARVNAWSVDLVTVRVARDECSRCGHIEEAHVLEDVPGELAKRGLCAECPDWHEFTSMQQT